MVKTIKIKEGDKIFTIRKKVPLLFLDEITAGWKHISKKSEAEQMEYNSQKGRELMKLMVLGVKDVETDENFTLDASYWENEADEDDWAFGINLLQSLGERMQDRFKDVKKKHPL